MACSGGGDDEEKVDAQGLPAGRWNSGCLRAVCLAHAPSLAPGTGRLDQLRRKGRAEHQCQLLFCGRLVAPRRDEWHDRLRQQRKRQQGWISGPVTLGVPGHLNTAYSFVPKSTVIVPNASDLVPGTATITVSYWLNTTTLPCCNAIDYDMFTKGDGSSKGGQIKIEVQGNGQASCMFRGSLGKKQLQAGPNVVDGQWHQVTCVRNGTQIVETVDGASFSVTKATGAITVTDTIRLGSHKGGGDWYRGVLDEVTYSIGS